MPPRVCVDASVALMLLMPHELTPQVRRLWLAWMDEGVDVVAPPLFFAEVTSVLRESVHFGRVPAADGEEAFAAFMKMQVGTVPAFDLQPDAWALAKEHSRPRAYDAQYLAVARRLRCDLWTGDQRLVRAVNAPWVRWVGASAPA